LLKRCTNIQFWICFHCHTAWSFHQNVHIPVWIDMW